MTHEVDTGSVAPSACRPGLAGLVSSRRRLPERDPKPPAAPGRSVCPDKVPSHTEWAACFFLLLGSGSLRSSERFNFFISPEKERRAV